MIIDAATLKRRYWRRLAGAREKKASIGPEVVAFDITNACNLTCQHCWFHSPGNPLHFKKARFFPWEKFLELVDDCVSLKVDEISLVGAGEPTMHPLFPKMMRHLEKQPLKVKLFTNATFPLNYCKDVIKGDHVIINLSASNEAQYRKLQGKDLFKRVITNIERLVSLRDAQKPGFFIEIVHIVNAVNIGQKQKMKDLAVKLGVNSIYFSRMNEHKYNQKIALLEDALVDSGGEPKRTPPSCLNGWFYMAAKLDGSFSTCCRIPQMSLGEGSLKKLWSSGHMMNMRLLGKHGHIQKMYKACQTCPYYDENIQRSKDLAEKKKK